MTVTDLLYLNDSYLRDFTSHVVSVVDHGIVLERTAFYPRGGGQMCDRGVLTIDRLKLKVIAVEKRAEVVYHAVEGPLPEPGADVRGVIDWDFRYNMMRTHTALHVLCGVIYRTFGAQVTGNQMYQDRARMDFTLADLTPDRIREIERRSNDAIESGLPVKVRYLPRKETNMMPELIRTKVNMIPEGVDPIRTVEIIGLDLQADGGTHVANTMEVGGLKITKTENKGRENRRLEIVLAPPMGG